MRSRNLLRASTAAPNAQEKRMDIPALQHEQTLEGNDDPDNVFISSSTSNNKEQQQKQKRLSTTRNSSNLISSQLHECLLQAAQHAQDLRDESQDLETENKKLKELVRQHRSSALDWCSVAKQYQQDRNYMALRLAELELELQLATTSNESDQNQDNEPGSSTRQNGVNKDGSFLNSYIGQSISQILDYMSPSNGLKEPKLPSLRKGSYTAEKEYTGSGKTASELAHRSALKSPSKSSSCNCGCQGEIKAWKSRCDFAENRVTLLELRCEKTNIVMDAYKSKWTQWKEAVVREQYQRRMKAAMSPQSASFVSLSSKSTQSSQELKHKDFRERPSADENKIIDRQRSEDNYSSQKRQEVTKRNTLLNQLMSVAPEDDSSDSPTSLGKSIHEEGRGANTDGRPHVIFEEGDGLDSSDILTQTPERRRSSILVHDSEGHDTSVEYVEQAMSLTFPSDLALSRRGQGFYELEEDDDDDSGNDGDNGNDSPEGGANGLELFTISQGKHRQYMDHSPTTRLSERSQRRANEISNNSINRDQDSRVGDRENAFGMSTGLMPSIASDTSSPPMFDSEDYAALHSPTKQGSKDIPQYKSRPALNDNFIHDTRTSSHIVILSQSPIPSDDPEKENKTPQDQPQDQLNNNHSNGDIDVNDEDVGDDEIGNESDYLQGQQQNGESSRRLPTDIQEQRVYNYTERRKDKRKQMHGQDCACCRRFYEITGPLPRPDGYSEFFTPAPRPGEKEIWQKTADERLQDRIQQISRHRVQHEQPLTPPGFWDTDFPSTQDRLEWDKVAQERRDRKKQRTVANQQQRGYRR